MAVSLVHSEPPLTPLRVAAIERIDLPSPIELQTRYVQPHRPVVFQGISDSWPARHWTLDLLARDFGDVSVQVALTRDGAVIADPRQGLLHRRTLLRDYLASLQSDRDAPYLMAPAEDLPEELRRAVSTPRYCEGAAWLATKFWLSRSAAVSAMHRDLADNLHTLIFGSKRFTLVDPRESANVYPNSLLSSIPNGCQTDIEAPDLERFPRLAGVHLMVAELQAGDTIYIPRRWWHHVRTTAVSLSVNHWWARGAWATVVKSADLFKRMRGISR